jgi:hypothetical protein
MAIAFWDSEADRSRAAVLGDLTGEDAVVEAYEIAYQV